MFHRAPGYWRRLERQRSSPFAGVSDIFTRYDLEFPTSMPDLRDSATLLSATDVSGEHDKASYMTYGLLVVDYDHIGDWLAAAGEFRQKHLEDRTMSFKALRDRQRLRALGPFLELSETLNGFLVVVSVHRDVASLFDAPFPPETDTPFVRAMRAWPSHILEQAGFLSHLLGVMLAGVASPGQNLLWLLDEGPIAAHDQRLSELTRLVGSTIAAYLPFRIGTLMVVTTKADSGDLAIEDLCSIPDLAAGAWSTFLQKCDQAGIQMTRAQEWHQLTLPTKSRIILTWWSSTKRNLECFGCRVVRAQPGNHVEWQFIQLGP